MPMVELPARARAVLVEHQTLVLATTDGDGTPEAASVFYAPVMDGEAPALVCAFLSSSGKLGHLRANPRAGIYVGPQTPTCWVQASATARIVEAAAEREARIAQLLAHAPGARVFVERVPVTAVVLTLTRLKLTDLTGARPPVEAVDFGRDGRDWPPPPDRRGQSS